MVTATWPLFLLKMLTITVVLDTSLEPFISRKHIQNQQDIVVTYCPGKDNIANIFTTRHPSTCLSHHLTKVNFYCVSVDTIAQSCGIRNAVPPLL